MKGLIDILFHSLWLFCLFEGIFCDDVEQKILSLCNKSDGYETLITIDGTSHTVKKEGSYVKTKFNLYRITLSIPEIDKSRMHLKLSANDEMAIKNMMKTSIAEVCLEVGPNHLNKVVALCGASKDLDCIAPDRVKKNIVKAKYCQENATRIQINVTDDKGNTKVSWKKSNRHFFFVKLNKIMSQTDLNFTVKFNCPNIDKVDDRLSSFELSTIERIFRMSQAPDTPEESTDSVKHNNLFNDVNPDDFQLQCKA